MKNILCYGDSNTWGLNPEWGKTGVRRLPWEVRWTGRLQTELGIDYRIIEEGLNGRSTVFDDPTAPGRNGLEFFPVCIESHLPLDLIIISLGTNDTKIVLNANEYSIAAGMEMLIKAAKNPFLYTNHAAPEILIAVPVPLGEGISERTSADSIDAVSVAKSKNLAGYYEDLSLLYDCHYIDLGQYAAASKADHVHLDGQAHARIAQAIGRKIEEILG